MDAQMFKAHKEKSSFKMDMKFVRSVILGPSTTNHENDPQMGCLCYYCKKHWQKTGGPPCFKLPRYAIFVIFSVFCDWSQSDSVLLPLVAFINVTI